MENLDILVIAAHPDDAELCCGGMLALSKKQGLTTGILDLTRGEMGSRGTVETRKREAEKAAEILKLDFRANVGLPDNGISNTKEHQDAVIQHIRALKPRLVFVSGPADRHPDHNHTHILTIESLFYSGLIKRETYLDGEKQAPFRPFHTVLYHHDWAFEPDFVLDVSDVVKVKKEAIKAYSTQFLADGSVDEPATYISSASFFEAKEAQMRAAGHKIGVAYGEAFQYYGGPLPFLGMGSLLGHLPKR